VVHGPGLKEALRAHVGKEIGPIAKPDDIRFAEGAAQDAQRKNHAPPARIFDFIGRDPLTYQPDSALSRFERPKNILSQPRVVNQRKGVPLWQILSQAGVPSTVLRCPCTFPAEALEGRLLAGVGVPDLRGSLGRGTFYTQGSAERAGEGEQLVSLAEGDEFTTRVIGPRNTRQNPPGDTYCQIKVRRDRARGSLVVDTGGTPARIEVPVGGWSEWVRFKFKFSLLQSVTGTARFYARQLEPQVEFYLSAVNFDPAAPMFPIASPSGYSEELAEKVGLFSTLGMAEEHNGLENGRLDEFAYLRQCELVLEERERVMNYELDRLQEGLLFLLYDTPRPGAAYVVAVPRPRPPGLRTRPRSRALNRGRRAL
jgi:hypothetical protein